jgi:hypothetical protein
MPMMLLRYFSSYLGNDAPVSLSRSQRTHWQALNLNFLTAHLLF